MNILDSGILCHKRPEKGGGGQNKLQRFSDGLIRVCGRVALRRAVGGFVVDILVVPRAANQFGRAIRSPSVAGGLPADFNHPYCRLPLPTLLFAQQSKLPGIFGRSVKAHPVQKRR